jgi:hypothetical protein
MLEGEPAKIEVGQSSSLRSASSGSGDGVV